MATVSFNLKWSAKLTFLDRKAVSRAVDKATHEVLWECGKKLRRRAQTSMRYVTSRTGQRRQVREGKRKRVRDYVVSKPGQPPKAVKPHPWLRRFLFYAWEPGRKTLVVGPVGLGRATGPRLLERGGWALIRNKRRRI
ncbi:MAG TPA: hypothetical protein VMW52_04570, partial [Phycisphaerae bacterium]|nr:hypothetical protein [Phycisphaerae bacterium]